MTTELVIFDCDGVLVDSERLALELNMERLKDINWPLTRAEVTERFMGRSFKNMLDQISEFLGGPVPEDWLERWNAEYTDKMALELEPVEGIADVIDELHQLGYATCVASSSAPEKIEANLTTAELFERLAGRIFSATEVEHGKPAPDLFLHAAATMGVAPARCVVVEDSRYGVQAARAAGMHVFAFAGGGMTPLEALEGTGTTVFHDMRELPGLIGALTDAAPG